nr:transposase, MuDR, MULE transposase domain protein [Tanacetum cinerariifolium]
MSQCFFKKAAHIKSKRMINVNFIMERHDHINGTQVATNENPQKKFHKWQKSISFEPAIPETPVYKAKPDISKQYTQQSEVEKCNIFDNKEALIFAVRLKAFNKGSIQGNKSGSCGHGWKQSNCANCIWYMQRGNRHPAIAMAVENEFHLAFHAPDAYEKLCQVGPQRWSRTHCPLVRYNYMTSNSVESVNACSVIYRKEPVLKLAETYRAMVQEWYFKRRQLAANMTYEITDWAANKVAKKRMKSATWVVIGVNEYQYQVSDDLVPLVDAIQERDTILMYTHHNRLHVYVSQVELSPLGVAEQHSDETNKNENQGKPSYMVSYLKWKIPRQFTTLYYMLPPNYALSGMKQNKNDYETNVMYDIAKVAGKLQIFVSHTPIDLTTVLIPNNGSLEESLAASNPENVRLTVLMKLQEALDEETILEEQMLALMHHFADRFTDRRVEINNLMVLHDHPLVDYAVADWRDVSLRRRNLLLTPDATVVGICYGIFLCPIPTNVEIEVLPQSLAAVADWRDVSLRRRNLLLTPDATVAGICYGIFLCP